jgi:acetyl-CoA carboxylase biotin carboxyl carrier protein
MAKNKSDIDHDLVRDLAALLSETDLSEIEIEKDNFRIRVARQITSSHSAIVHAPPPVAAPSSGPLGPSGGGEAPALDPSADAVTSPMVGTAYLAPEPGASPYVKVGDQVKEGQTILIVEAMKTMNQIVADRSGQVKAILVEDGQPVEYGDPLVTIR